MSASWSFIDVFKKIEVVWLVLIFKAELIK